MTRTAWIRLGSTLLALATVAPPSRAALIRHEFTTASPFDADAPPPWWELARSAPPATLDFQATPLVPDAADARPLNAYYSVYDECRIRGPVSFDGMPSDFRAVRSESSAVGGDGGRTRSTAVEGSSSEPPLTLAGFLGGAAWAVFHRRRQRREERPPRRSDRRPAPVRETGTAIVPSLRFDVAVVERALVLPARFVAVSTTTLPVPRAEARAVVQRRGRARRTSNENLVRDR